MTDEEAITHMMMLTAMAQQIFQMPLGELWKEWVEATEAQQLETGLDLNPEISSRKAALSAAATFAAAQRAADEIHSANVAASEKVLAVRPTRGKLHVVKTAETPQ